MTSWLICYLEGKQWLFPQEQRPMTCLGQTDQRSVQVHRLGLHEFGVPDEVERMVLLFAVSAESWCL